MKKKLLKLLSILAAVCCLSAIASCNEKHSPDASSSAPEPTPHEHVFSAFEELDDDSHTAVCECGKRITAKHTLSKHKCGQCGQVVFEENYFQGNVFQIVAQDLGEQPIAFGSGFVFNKEGYFITNSHVMEDSYNANALFEIPDNANGLAFTTLKISKALANQPSKDYFIGKIENYGSISSYYQEIPFQTEHTVGQTTFSVGYPEATPYMEIHKGVTEKDSTWLGDKLNGVDFIVSTSYIMPGSSGGVLLNDNLEVIGITTRGKFSSDDEFLMGYSISPFTFVNDIKNVSNLVAHPLADYLHPDDKEYIKFFNALKNDSSLEKEIDTGLTEKTEVFYGNMYEEEGVNSDNTAYSYSETFVASSAKYIVLVWEYYWASGARKEMGLFGYWDENGGFDFFYNFTYTFESGAYYTITSSDVNYSENVDLTLKNYEIEGKQSNGYSTYTPTQSNITYAKENFNSMYREFLITWDLRNS